MVEYTGPIQHKRATSEVWASATVPLREGEIGVDLTVKRIKVGDGSTLFPDLPWATPDNTTIAELEALAEQIGDTVSLADAQMTAVAGDAGSAFHAQQSAAIAQVAAWAKNPDSIIAGSITRNSDQAVTSAAVVWPDGTPGTFTADTLSTAFPGAIDAYHITYGSPVLKTFTQPAITRNAAGAATTVPQIVVS